MAAVPKAYLAAVAAASQKYHVPAELLAAQIEAESNWNPKAKSSAGAIGISQFMPGTAKGMGINPNDPFASIDAQGRMMGRLIKSYGGNTDKALAAYNAGSGNVAKYGGIPPFPETQSYISNIHKYEADYPGLAKGTVERAAAYDNILNSVSDPSQTAPKASSGSGQGNPSSQPYDASQALTGYLINQSRGGHAGDPTGELLNLLQTNQASLDVTTARGSKSIPINRESTSPVDHTELKIVGDAKKYLGTKYLWGGTTPAGFDCSGFVQYVHRLEGVNIPRTTYEQLKAGKPISRQNLKPGDAIFFHKGEHEGMYIGNGKFIQAPHTGDVVKISDLATYGGYYTARRFGK